jgi:D-alanyl-D-alanine dipeptidase
MMPNCRLVLALVAILTAACNRSTIVNIQSVNPHVVLDIRYATTNNFTGKKVYDSANCLLRASTARKLSDAQRELEQSGLGLKVYDCYRPLAVQRKFWSLVPDERYVANPAKGSRHNRGAAVDLTLVDRNGQELPMPTPFDDFTDKAHRDYTQLPPEALKNRALLEQVMTRHGFVGLPTEWWHFDDADWPSYPIIP